MRPDKVTVYDLFYHQRRYVVPLFQRPYVWNVEEQWRPLWEDITQKANQINERNGNNEGIGPHFLGAAVIKEQPTYGKQVRTYEIIDGQQRLTTLQVLLVALRRFLINIAHEDSRLDDDLERLTTNSGTRAEENERFKVWPTTSDRATFQLVFDAETPNMVRERISAQGSPSARLAEAFEFFYSSIDEYIRFGENDDEIESPEYGYDSQMAHTRIDALVEALRRYLEIVVIELEPGDDPQIIFETLNARGVPLYPSDLIRNFVFLEASRTKEDVEHLYNKYWLGYDDDDHGQARFWKSEEEQGRVKRPRIDLFIFHYLTLKLGREVRITHLFQEFRHWWQQTRDQQSVESYLADMARYSKAYHHLMTLGGQSRLGVFMRRLAIMNTNTVYPILMYLYVERTDIPATELEGMLNDLESYLVRRMVCGLSAQNYNRNFLMVLRDLRRAEQLNRLALREILSGFEGDAGRWPTDEDFQQAWLYQPFYNRLAQPRQRMLLEAIDLQMETSKQEKIHIEGTLTIEHIYPRNPEPGIWAPLANPVLLHTVGNLTLLTTALNSSVSNGAFQIKRPEIAKQSRLRLNSYFQDLVSKESWGDEDILHRSQELFALACRVWPAPPDTLPNRLAPGQQRALDSLSEIADQEGVGEPFRQLLDAGLRLGFFPRTDTSSIMLAPPANKNYALYTFWLHPRENRLRVYISTETINKFFQFTESQVEQALGPSGWHEMNADDVSAFVKGLESLFS